MIITDKILAARRNQRVDAALCAMTIAVSLVALSVSQSAMAGTTTSRPVPINRDHRGQDTGTPVKIKVPTDPAGKEIGWGNYHGKKGGGATVRDHR